MNKVIQKIKLRNRQFKNHPVTKYNRFKALYRYFEFNFLIQFKSTLKYHWINDLELYVSKGDAGIIGNIYYGLFEFNESMFLLHFLRPSDTFLDVGANLGHYSLLASGIKKCNSICIEPVPETYEKLKEQIRLNSLENKITPHNIGFGNISKNLHFSTDKNAMNRVVNDNYKNSVEVHVDTMDNFCNDLDFALIKIDVEGYEKFVLEGAESFLNKRSLKAIIVEINFSNKFYNINNDEVASILNSYGFIPYEYYPKKRKLIELSSYNKAQFNTIFIRDISYVKDRLKNCEKIEIWNILF